MKKQWILRIVIALMIVIFTAPQVSVLAAAVVTAATGGSSISADTTGSSWTSLTGPVLAEGSNRDIGVGAIVLTAPAGFEFNTGASVTVAVTKVGAGTSLVLSPDNTTPTITITASTITITVLTQTQSGGGNRSTITWSGIQVRPTAGTPLASGNMYIATGGATINGITKGSAGTNFGTLTEVAGEVTQLAFTSSPVTAVTGVASSSITVQRQDQFGNPNSSEAARTVTLSSDSAGTVTFTPASPITINSGSSSASFTYTDTQVGTPIITAASASPTSITSATQQETVVAPGPATKLVITSAAKSTVAGVASSAITVQRQDSSSNPNTADPTITLTLSSNSTGTVTFNPPSPQITTGTSSVTFTYTDTKAGTPTITVASAGLTSATQQETVTAAAASKLVMKTEPSSSVVAGAVFATQPAVYVQDTYDNIVTTDSSTVTAIVATGVGSLTGTTTAVVSGGTATFSGLAAPLTPQTGLYLGFTDGALSPALSTTSITVTTPPNATKLVITGSTSQVAGASQNLTITAKDDTGTTVPTYTGSKSLTFSGANSSTNPVTTPKVKDSSGGSIAFGSATLINFTNGVATVSGGNNGVMTLYKAETAIVCVTDGTIGSIGSDCLSVVVSPGTATKLAFTTAPVTMPAGVASSSITVQRQDAYGNPNTADAARTVTLTSNSVGTVTFTPASPLTIAMGSSSVSFTYTDSMAGTPTITAASTSPTTITSATQQETVAAGTPTATTSSATAVNRTSARLNGSVNAGGGSATVSFEYGPTTSYGSSIAATPSTVTGASATAVYADLTGTLTPGSTYHFRVVAVSGALTIYGSDLSFTTDPAGSITYYVNNSNLALCSDSYAGTDQAHPFCTIYKATTLADAGDKVSVLAGTYAETVKTNFNGGAGMPITFLAAPGVTVTGEAGNSSNGGAFRIFNKGYIVIDGFTITGTADYGIILTSSHHMTIQNNKISNSGSASILRHGIYLTGTTYSSVIGNTTYHNTWDGIRLNNGSNNNWIEKNVSYGNATVSSNTATGINLLQNSNYNTLIRNITYANEDTGLNLYTGSSHNLLINNLTYGNGDHGIDNNGAPYNTIIGNTVHGNVTVGINVEMDSSGNGSGGAVLMNNISADNGYLLTTNGSAFPTAASPGNIRVDTTSVSSPAATTMNFDLIYTSNPSYPTQILWGGNTYTSMAAFKATGQEANGLQGDPKFVSPAPIAKRPPSAPYNIEEHIGDYHIDTGSPAIDSANSGAPSEQTVDIEGSARVDDPGTANTGLGTRTYDDRGAYEYQIKNPQTISWTSTAPTTATYQGPTYTPGATATSGLPVVITVDGTASSVCSISAGVVSFIGVGNCVINANQPGNINWAPAPQIQQTFTVGKGIQSISVTTHAPSSAAYLSSFSVAATASSGLPVTYTATGVCTNVGATFTMNSSTGTCTVHYNQAGNTLYNAATEITEAVTATNLAQTITVTMHAPANAAYLSSFSVAATASSGLPVTYSASGACTNSGATFTMSSGTGTCVVHYNQIGSADYAAAPEITESVTATKINQTITFAAPASPAAYNSSFTVSPTSSSGLAVTVTPTGICSIVGYTVTMNSSSGTCTLTASQAGDANYNPAADVVRTVNGTKANQVIQITKHAPPSAVNNSHFSVAATASSGLPVTYSASGACTNIGANFTITSGVGTCIVYYNQTGDGNYNAAPEKTEFVVASLFAKTYLPLVIR